MADKKVYVALDMRGNKLKSVADPTAAQDAATKAWAEGRLVGTIADGTTTVTPVTELDVPPHSLSAAGSVATVDWDRLHVIAASGAAKTLSLVDGDTIDITLTANCTFTLAGATNGRSCFLSIVTRQDATGGRAITWPGSVSWLGSTPAPSNSPSEVNVYVLWTFDGGTHWGGVLVGSANTTLHFEPHVAYDGTVVLNGNGDPVMVLVA